MIRVLGCDLALTATGIAEPDGTLHTFKPLSYSRGMARLKVIRDHILHAAVYDLPEPVDIVAIEGYAYASGNGAHQLGEVGGVVRLALWEHDIPVVDIPPSSLKKYATGKANAGKLEVALAAAKRLGVEPADDHQADAATLRAMTLDAAGEALVVMPATHRAALERIAWPPPVVPDV